MATKHGHHGEPEYVTWKAMKQRCYDANAQNFKHYGGKGIAVCDRWRDSFENFLADMGRKPSTTHSIERIDNSNGYSPENCRWATIEEQRRHTSQNVMLTARGQTKTMAEWARDVGLTDRAIANRLARGLSHEHAIFDTPREWKSKPRKRHAAAT